MIKSIGYYKNLIFRVKFKRLLQLNPYLYISIQMFRYRGKRYQKKIVAKNTDIVIEGFPRSANSFSVKAFEYSNGNNYKIATHLHAYSQVIVGVKYKIPTLLLIRNPYDCIISYAALNASTYGLENFKKNNDIKWMLNEYISYYKNLLPYKEKLIIGDFPNVLSDFGLILDELNKKFNTKFNLFEHTKENVDSVFKIAKKHLSPSKERELIKEDFTQQMISLKKSNSFKEAEKLYQIWTANKI